jgi:hypothetical protein
VTRGLRIAAFAAALVLVLAAALEIGTRTYLRARGRPLDPESRRAWIASVCAEMTNHGEVADDLAPGEKQEHTALLEPFVAWSDAKTEARRIDDAEAYARADSKAAFDVLLLGGAAGSELGASAAFAERLRADPRCRGRELRLHVYAEPGFKEPQSSILLGCLFSFGHEPDLVLAVDGRDEARIGARNAASKTHPLFPSVEDWARATRGMRTDWALAERIHALEAARDAARRFGERALRFDVERSAFLGHLALGRLASLRERAVREGRELLSFVAGRPHDAELDGPRFDASAEAVAATIAGGWERAARLMHAMCAARGIEFLEVLEPIPTTEDGRAVEGLRAAAARLKAAGVPVEDLSRLPTGEGTDHREEALAEAIVAAIGQRTDR